MELLSLMKIVIFHIFAIMIARKERMKEIALPIGSVDFKDIRISGDYYVDKTYSISEILSDSARAILFTRPRRFGKTTFITMLKYFFDIREDSKKLFKNLMISKDREICDKWQNNIPVIYLTLKDVDGFDFHSALSMLQDLFLDLFQSYDFILEDDMPNGNRLLFNRILNKEASESDIRESLKVLAKLLATHYKKEVMILIDEYDVPLDKAERNGYYDEMLSLLRTLFSSVLKDNPNVRKSILTGCLRISKESLFTGLNNLSVCSIASHRYSTSFGFTESEVDQLLIDMGFEDKKSIIRTWYDGYRIGDTMIYAPWDVLSYLRDIQIDCNALPNNYWANTSNNEIIRHLIDETGSSISNDYSTLINGDAIAKRITENITYNDLYTEENNIWSLMLETGYLTLADRFQPNGETLLRIPNEEIRQLFITTVNKWFSDSMKREDISPLFDAIWDTDTEMMERILNRYMAKSISYYDYSETYYHAFLTGLLSARGYSVRSNVESGLGRPDIILSDNENSRSAIFEIKQAKKEEDISRKQNEAAKQIKALEYGNILEDYNKVILYTAVFYRKKVFVRTITNNWN